MSKDMQKPRPRNWIRIALVSIVALPILHFLGSFVLGDVMYTAGRLIADRSCRVKTELAEKSPDQRMLVEIQLQHCDEDSFKEVIVYLKEHDSATSTGIFSFRLPRRSSARPLDLVNAQWRDRGHLLISHKGVTPQLHGRDHYKGVAIEYADIEKTWHKKNEEEAWRLIRKSHPEVTRGDKKIDVYDGTLSKNIANFGNEGDRILTAKISEHGEVIEEYLINLDRQKSVRVSGSN